MAQRFPKSERLRRRRDFLRVQSTGKRVHTPHFVVMLQPAECRRLGITVTRRISGAVGRNRIRRMVRELYRRERERFPEACEIVVVARKGAGELGYHVVADELIRATGAMDRALGRHSRMAGPRP